MLLLQNRVAIVTGSGGGLGRAHALFLASQGAKIIVNDVSEANAAGVVEEIVAAGGEAMPAVASVTDQAAIATMVANAMNRWGRVDILINNAGILRDKSFAKMTIDDFRLVLEVHLVGAAICSKEVWQIMRGQGYGRIVVTTSSSGLYGNFGQANYAAAKMGLVGLMQTLAIEGERHGIRVNALAPTAATQMTEGVLSEASLDLLDPALVSPGLIALVGEEAPTRTILCAGAGHFATANVTLTTGTYIGGEGNAAERVLASWSNITDRKGETVPPNGGLQVERGLASASMGTNLAASARASGSR